MNKLVLDKVIEQSIKDVVENVTNIIATKYDSFIPDITDIDCEDREGFWSHNNGGYEADIVSNLSLSYGSGKYPHKKVEQCAKRQARDCVKYFCDDNNITNYCYDAIEAAGLADEFEDFERAYCEDDFYFIVVRALFINEDNFTNKAGYSHVVFDIAYNLDSYGRESHCHNIIEIVVPVNELTVQKIAEVEQSLLKFC